MRDPFATEHGHRMESGRAPLTRFRRYPNNPRTHPPEEIALLAELLKKYGDDQPIVVDEEWVIIKGHGRLDSAFLAELEDFSYVMRFGLSDADKRAMRIQDNQLSLLAGWDPGLIRIETQALKLEGYPLQLLGFGQVELVTFTTTPGPETPAGATTPSNLGSLADRFGVVPFSVLNAREGWWQDRKRAWLSLGIQSELGRGENLIGRSPQELFCHLTGIPYGEARKIVADAMAAEGDAFDFKALVAKHGGRASKVNVVPGGGNRMPLDRSSDFSKSGAVIPPGTPGGMTQGLRAARGYTAPAKAINDGASIGKGKGGMADQVAAAATRRRAQAIGGEV